jgi:hypothetical protein
VCEVYLRLILSKRQRNGGDLSWRINVTTSIPALRDGWPTGSAQVTLHQPASRWLQQLASVGAAASLTVVVPAPLAEGERQQMSVRLREAQAAIGDGRYADAVSSARLALETARRRETLAPEKTCKDKDPKLRSADERWSALHRAVWGLANLPHHDDDVTADVRWIRGDAVAVVAATAALIARQG